MLRMISNVAMADRKWETHEYYKKNQRKKKEKFTVVIKSYSPHVETDKMEGLGDAFRA